MKITNLLEATIASMPEPGQVSFRSGRSETSLEEMTAGSVASVPMPIGKVIKRESGITKGIKKKMVDEGEITETDLIMVPGIGKRLKPGLIPKDKVRTDHEVEMARSDLVQSVKNAKTIFSLIKDLSEDEGLEGWVQEKITKAEDYLNTVRQYLEGKMIPSEGMSAGVRMQRALQREKEKRERSERYAEKHFPIGKKPEPKQEPQQEVKEGDQDWMDELRAMAHKMAPQDKMRERQAERDAQAKAERQQRIQQDIENLPDLISQYNNMEAEYESMGGKNWQYADNEQNLSDEERKARGMETSMRQLADRIHTAKKASEGLAESKPDFAKMFNKKIGKHNAAVVKTKKEIGTRVADIGAGGKEYNVKTDKEWDKQKSLEEGQDSNEIGPGWKTEHGIVDRVEGNSVIVKTSKGKMRVNMHDIKTAEAPEQGVTEMIVGKRKPKPDSYHINKDGKPVSLASYSDKDSAIKDRDEKHPGAEVHQVGSRGKVKGKFEEGAKVDRMVGHVKSSEKKLGHSDKEAENIAWATANKRGMLDNKNKKVEEESKGLWANIHAKRDRIKHGSGEKMRKPGSKGAPTADALRKSAK
jgi:hypothetical protein